MLSLEPSADGRRMLPPGWRPPAPFTVRVFYWDPGRAPEDLWLMPYHRHPSGAQIYLAVGPAGKRVDAGLVRAVDLSAVPKNAAVQLVTDRDSSGLTVFAPMNHTLN